MRYSGVFPEILQDTFILHRFGLEQEYTLLQKDVKWPLGWPLGGYPGPQVKHLHIPKGILNLMITNNKIQIFVISLKFQSLYNLINLLIQKF
jgi:hypothetical protein